MPILSIQTNAHTSSRLCVMAELHDRRPGYQTWYGSKSLSIRVSMLRHLNMVNGCPPDGGLKKGTP